ncbi:hypothetical protein [Mesorhizobium sp. WSM4313]|uniref:hypothetical protein n=1 Tax=Mesorhizobium sp. WSM4313 TaxID=2029412 RepID=UPI001596D5DC|nr:hypothetical protein [Mesorhizobium sp. WSM4313]
MNEAEKMEFKARLAVKRERVLRRVLGDQKAEARLAQIARYAVKRKAIGGQKEDCADGC